MNKKKHSLKDIAKTLGVSVTTVSFVINGKGKENKISDEVIEKVLAYTKEINYQPNKIAQSLRTGETKILVFMVEDISNKFFANIARIIEDLAYPKGYKVIFCSNDNSDERARILLQTFLQRQVDGFIITPTPNLSSDIESLVMQNIPVVLFDRYFPNLNVDSVVIDNEFATNNAVKHLIENSFKRIGFVTLDDPQTQMAGRLAGYQTAIQDANMKAFEFKVNFPIVDRESVKARIYDFFKSNDLDAIFFTTNYLTQMGLEVIRENAPDMLNKLGIITFDDNEFFSIHQPSISAVEQPIKRIGQELFENIFRKLKGTDTGIVKQTIIPTIFIERESTQFRS